MKTDHNGLLQTGLLILIVVLVILHGISMGKKEPLETTALPISISAAIPCSFFDFGCRTAGQQEESVLEAMRVMATLERPGDLDALMLGRSGDPRALAVLIVRQAKERRLDPLLLVVMAWIETRFDPSAVSDYINRPEEGRNCGLLQVRTDLPGRPSCEDMKDPEKNVAWAAEHLQDIAWQCDEELCLSRYNAGDYETRVWRKLDWLRRQLWLKESR